MKNNQFCVAVCIVTYNQEKYIAQALESVLAQRTDFDVAIFIGNDCSTDKTLTVCAEYQKKYPEKIKLLLQEKNKRLIQNYNDAMSLCRGKYIAICGGDDYWIDEYKLQKQVDFLEKNKDYGLIATAFYVEKGNKRERWEVLSMYECDYNFDDFLQVNRIGALSVCFRGDLYSKYLNDINPLQKEWLMEDYPFWLWVSANTKVKYIPDITAVYRILENSISNSNNCCKKLIFELNVLEIREFFANKYNKMEFIFPNLQNSYNQIVSEFYRVSCFEKTKFLKDKIYYYNKQVSIPSKIKLLA